LSRDPEDGKASDPKSLQKYLYAGGDPVNRIDPAGRADEEDYLNVLWRIDKTITSVVSRGLYTQEIDRVYFCAGISSYWWASSPAATADDALLFFSACMARLNGEL
jgi:hypothetical protein